MMELKLNITDTDLMGSDSSLEKMKEVISKYQLKFNNYKGKKIAYESCRADAVCSKVVSATNSEILNSMQEDAYSTTEN